MIYYGSWKAANVFRPGEIFYGGINTTKSKPLADHHQGRIKRRSNFKLFFKQIISFEILTSFTFRFQHCFYQSRGELLFPNWIVSFNRLLTENPFFIITQQITMLHEIYKMKKIARVKNCRKKLNSSKVYVKVYDFKKSCHLAKRK